MSHLLTAATTALGQAVPGSGDLGALPPAWRWATKAGYFAALCASAGTLLTALVVLRPALRGAATSTAVRVGSLVGRTAAIATLLLLPLLYLRTAAGIARHGDGDFVAALAPSAVAAHLTAPREPGAWIAEAHVAQLQVLLAVAAAAVLLPLLRRAPLPLRLQGRLLAAATVLTLGVGLSEAIPRTAEDLETQALLGTLFDQLHVIGAEAWLGGLLLLAVLSARHRTLADATVTFWAEAWRRFSLLATASVAALAVSGLWLAWRHMGSPGELLTTTYGVVLLVKLLVVGALLGLGAWNQVAVLPRLHQLRRAGHDEPLLRLAVHHLGRVVQVEVALGAAVLVAGGFLAGSARAEAGDPDAVLTAQVGAWGVGFVAGMGALLWVTARVAGFLATRPLPAEA